MADTGATGAAGPDAGRLRSRSARPDDYDAITAVVNQWWGRPVLAALPGLFPDHFHSSSLVVDGPEGPVAFLVGILSPAQPGRAYIQFAGVAPQARQAGLRRPGPRSGYVRAPALTAGARPACHPDRPATGAVISNRPTRPIPGYRRP